MLARPTRIALCELLLATAAAEHQAEIIRHLLCEFRNFHPYSAFKSLEAVNPKGSLDVNDLARLLSNNGFDFFAEDLHAFIALYDQDHDGSLQYSEFLRVVLPSEDLDLRQSVTLKQPSLADPFDAQIEYTLAKLVYTELDRQRQLDLLKLSLSNCPDFTPTLCFQSLNSAGSNKLTAQDLKDFFQRNSLIVYDDEVKAMLRRIDFLADGVIDPSELTRFLALALPERHKTAHFLPGASPLKSSQYLSRYLHQPQLDSTLSFKTPTKHQEKSNPKIAYSAQKESRSKGKNKIINDETMSNVLTQSRVNFNTKIVKTMSQSPKKKEGDRTPQKYIQQKADLRAQLATQKVFSGKKLSKTGGSKEKNSSQGNKSLVLEVSPYKQLKESTQQSQSLASTKFVNSQSKALQESAGKQGSSSSRVFQNSPSLLLGEVLMAITELEARLESAKVQLAKKPEFNLFDAFRVLDKSKVGFLSSADIESFTKVSKGSMQTLVGKYGYNGKLRFSDFIRLVQPRAPDYSQYLQDKKPLYEPTVLPADRIFQAETQRLYRDLLTLLVDTESQLEKLKDRIKCMPLEQAFNLVDQLTQDGVLTSEDLEEFFFQNDLLCTWHDIFLLSARLGANVDGQVTYSDFAAFFSSK